MDKKRNIEAENAQIDRKLRQTAKTWRKFLLFSNNV